MTMGGTDLNDGRLAQHKPKVKTISWIPRMLIHFLNVSVVNCYILFTLHTHQPKDYTLLDFTKILTLELCDELLELIRLKEHTNTQPHTKKGWEKESSRLIGKHTPYMSAGERVSEGTKDRCQDRTRCVMCGTKVPTRCQNCSGVYLSLRKEENSKNCWERFHNDKTFDGKWSDDDD
jgi:hypothetical protein